MHNGRCPVKVVSDVPVVAAPEEIDMISAPELRSALLEAAADGHGTLVVDMTQTQFCDSSGVHTLLAAHERAQAEGGELLLVVSATIVLRIFDITGLDRVVRNFPSLDKALPQAAPLLRRLGVSAWTGEAEDPVLRHARGPRRLLDDGRGPGTVV